MILRRIIENLKTQNWTAIALELGIVIIGVIIGMQVSNWNQQRIEKRETERLLQELRPALKGFADYFDTIKPFHATTRAYSDTAFAGWRGDPKVSDEQFVIGAYQASQIFPLGVNGENWAAIFGSQRLLEIDNAEVRQPLINLMTFNYEGMEMAALATPYREHVRSAIPADVQEAIRAKCGHVEIPEKSFTLRLPETCDLDLPDTRFAEAAAKLRSHPELVDELNWHIAALATFFANLGVMEAETRQLQQALDKTAR